jgi:hypothetical protein
MVPSIERGTGGHYWLHVQIKLLLQCWESRSAACNASFSASSSLISPMTSAGSRKSCPQCGQSWFLPIVPSIEQGCNPSVSLNYAMTCLNAVLLQPLDLGSGTTTQLGARRTVTVVGAIPQFLH